MLVFIWFYFDRIVVKCAAMFHWYRFIFITVITARPGHQQWTDSISKSVKEFPIYNQRAVRLLLLLRTYWISECWCTYFVTLSKRHLNWTKTNWMREQRKSRCQFDSMSFCLVGINYFVFFWMEFIHGIMLARKCELHASDASVYWRDVEHSRRAIARNVMIAFWHFQVQSFNVATLNYSFLIVAEPISHI